MKYALVETGTGATAQRVVNNTVVVVVTDRRFSLPSCLIAHGVSGEQQDNYQSYNHYSRNC